MARRPSSTTPRHWHTYRGFCATARSGIGTSASGNAAGTKLYSLSGDVLHPGLYELPMGTSLASLVFQHGGGMLQGKEFKAVFTGGPSNTLLTQTRPRRCAGLRLGAATPFASRYRCDDRRIGRHQHRSQGRRVRELLRAGFVRPVSTLQGRHLSTDAAAQPDRHRSRCARRLEALENLCRILPDSGRCGLIDGAVTVVESSVEPVPGRVRGAPNGIGAPRTDDSLRTGPAG